MTLISIIKQQQLLIYSTQFKLQTQRWMGNFIRESIAKREMLAGKKSHPHWNPTFPRISCCSAPRLIIRERFSQIAGASLGSFWCPSNSLLFHPPRLPGSSGLNQLPQAPWAVWALLQGGHRDRQEGQWEAGESLPPHLPGTTQQRCQRGSRTQDVCVSPRMGAAQWADGKLAFSSFYSCPRNQHMVCKPIKLTHGY